MPRKESKVSYRENETSFSLCVPKPSLRYLDQFIRLKCAPDLLKLEIFPNAKEISESMAAFGAARKAVGAPRFGDKNVLLLDVGAGVHGRTGALFALLTRWTCISVDPALREIRYPGIERWIGVPAKIEDFRASETYPLVVAVCVHSHAKLQAVWEAIKHVPDKLVISIPCCVPQSIQGLVPIAEKEDWGIWSEKRTVTTWQSPYRSLRATASNAATTPASAPQTPALT